MPSEMVERLAVRLFWKAEHLDPSEEGDVPESEWFGDSFPKSMEERRREFWRLLICDVLAGMRVPTTAMIEAAIGTNTDIRSPMWIDGWRSMIDAALADSELGIK